MQSLDTPEPQETRTPMAFTVAFIIATLMMGMLILQFWVPIFLGVTLSVTLFPIHRRLTQFLRGRTGWSALFCTLGLFLVVVSPLVSVTAYSASEIVQGLAWLQQNLQVESVKELSFSKIPTAIADMLEPSFEMMNLDASNIQEILSQALSSVQHMIPKIFSVSLAAIVNLFLTLLSVFVFLSEGQALQNLLLQVSPLRRLHTNELLNEFHAVASASLIGLGVTSSLQALVVMLGFFCAGIPHVFFFGIVTLIASFIPIVGSTLVWLPAVGVLAFQSAYGAAIGLAIWSAVSINIIDNGIKPWILQGRMAMPMPLAFLGLLSGLSLFGPVGMIAGPLVVAFFTVLLRIYRRDYLEPSQVLQT